MPAPRSSQTSVSGWEFSSTSGPISGAPQLLALGRRLADPYVDGDAQMSPFCVHGATRSLKPCMCGSALVMGVRMHLPEAVFGDNSLVITHRESGFTLAFTAEGALKCWARDSVKGDHDSSSVRCAPAELPVWRKRMVASTMRTSTAVDWTFCCADYAGDEPRAEDARIASAAATFCCAAAPQQSGVMGGLVGFGSTSSTSAQKKAARARVVQPVPAWRPHRGAGLDMDLLRQREEILWSADIPLYEDNLHDNGVSEVRVRARVMASCFLVLFRHTLRVDGVQIQQREVRVFHKFGSGVVLRSVRSARKAVPPLPSAAALRASAAIPGDMTTTVRAPPAGPAGVSAGMMPPNLRGPPLDEQGISEILSRVPAQEAIDEIALRPPSDAADGVGEAQGGAADGGRAAPPHVHPASLSPVALGAAPLDAPLSTLSLSADGRHLLAGDLDGGLALLELRADGEVRPTAAIGCSERWRVRLAHKGAVLAAAFPPRPGWAVTCGEDGSCAAWSDDLGVHAPIRRWHLDCKTADRVHYYEAPPPADEGSAAGQRKKHSFAVVQAIVCEPDDTSSGFAAAVGASVFLLDTNQQEPRRRLAAKVAVTALAYIEARRCLCASGYGGVLVWADYGMGAATRLVYKGPLDTLAVAPDTRYAACGAQDSTLVLWPLAPSEAERVGSEADAPAVMAAEGGRGDAVASEAEAALLSGAALFFGGGCYEQKVVPLGWDASGRLCASAGGRHLVVWDMGAAGSPPPVRENGRASLLLGHTASVSWLGFKPRGGCDQDGGQRGAHWQRLTGRPDPRA